MEKTLGQMIGVVKHSFTCTPSDGSKGYPVQCSYDFTNSSDPEIKSWLTGSRAIAQAKTVNRLTMNEIDTLVNGKTFPASGVGNKIASRSEQIDKLVSIGLAREFAELAVDNPARFEAIQKMMVEQTSEDELENE